MYFSDPLYLLLMVVGLLVAFVPQMILKGIYGRFDQTPNSRGLTGAEVANNILRDNGVHDVVVEPINGFLSDHYDPSSKRIRLSEEHYYGRSVAGVAVAAHEVGHALQHAQGYFPVVVRSAMVPAVNLGSNLGPILLMVSLMLGATSQVMPDWAFGLAWLGIFMFAAAVLFHIVTLPVEIDASMRAVRILAGNHYLTQTELPGAKQVLTAAAFTYVATALYSLMQLLYYVFRVMGMRRSED
jgi:Zn-dependent membrane protease YugP